MVANPLRRVEVTDAALSILGRQGSRALTHRAVDAQAGLPSGTCANYVPTRSALLLAAAQRVFERLAPTPDRLIALQQVPEDEALPEYVGYIVERVMADPDLWRALLELRLEAARSPEIHQVLAPFLRAGVEADVEFHLSRGLPGGRPAVLALHHVVNGLLLDALTVSLEPGVDVVTRAKDLTRQLLLAGR